MRKLISTFLLSLMLLAATNAQTIFDPATFAGTLPAGMEVVEIDGESYLQVVLDGWNSSLEIPVFTIVDLPWYFLSKLILCLTNSASSKR